MGPMEALELALNREKQSIKLYEKFARQFSVAKDTFLFLMGEEEKHQQLIEKEMVRLRLK
ncbi:MAG: hypothetical protein Q8N85_00265 [Candidatus Omnitrophota bacterium]|nr:hypothetical protein [Candidatus Omnitrophota bacterium]